MESERLEQEHLSFELKWAGEKDAEAYQRKLAEERRNSFKFRHTEGHRQRDEAAQRRSQEQNAEHASYELKWAGEKDAEAYKKQLEQERRDSFKFRHTEGHRQREEEALRRSEEQNTEHASYELKWAGEKDAEAYKKQLEQERRDSFKFRHTEGHRQREEEALRRSEEQSAEHASYELKWAGEKDAEAYQRKLAEERRNSFKFRHTEGHRQREEEALRRSEEQNAEHVGYELKWAGEKDAEAYKQQLEQERRDSFKFRHTEGHRQREEEALRRLERAEY